MTRKNTLKSLPTDTEFRVVGLDLAKSDVSVAAIPVDDNTPSLVDRMTYADLLDWAGKIDRTSEGGTIAARTKFMFSTLRRFPTVYDQKRGTSCT